MNNIELINRLLIFFKYCINQNIPLYYFINYINYILFFNYIFIFD